MVQVGNKGRMTLTGHEDELFLRRDNPDGSILLEPAVVKSRAQEEYDTNPELRELLRRAAASPTVEWDYKA